MLVFPLQTAWKLWSIGEYSYNARQSDSSLEQCAVRLGEGNCLKRTDQIFDCTHRKLDLVERQFLSWMVSECLDSVNDWMDIYGYTLFDEFPSAACIFGIVLQSGAKWFTIRPSFYYLDGNGCGRVSFKISAQHLQQEKCGLDAHCGGIERMIPRYCEISKNRFILTFLVTVHVVALRCKPFLMALLWFSIGMRKVVFSFNYSGNRFQSRQFEFWIL